jgi:hypothetical protein
MTLKGSNLSIAMGETHGNGFDSPTTPKGSNKSKNNPNTLFDLQGSNLSIAMGETHGNGFDSPTTPKGSNKSKNNPNTLFDLS